MIGALKGIVRSKHPEKILLDVGGIFFEVNITLNTYYRVNENDTVYLYTYTYLTDGELSLYGFLNSEEKKMFETLLKVHGIGPRFARNVLSGTTPENLRKAIHDKDIASLVKIPGIGRKLAEKILFELKSVMFIEDKKEVYSDVVDALVNLGFKRKEAEDVVESVKKVSGDKLSTEDALKEALKLISGKRR